MKEHKKIAQIVALNKTSPELTNTEQIEQENKLIIDEWFANNFNGSKALLKYRPNVGAGSSRTIFAVIKKNQKAYIQHKRNELRSSVSIQQENVIKNLIDWIQADATDYLALTPEELKALPVEARQSIASINHKKKTYKDRQGEEVTEETLAIKLIDKIKTLEILNKMLGYYELDNRQKSKTLDISKASPDQLNAVLSLMTQQGKENEEETIDID